MPKHEIKECGRCGAAFECKPGDVAHCHCYTVRLSPGMQHRLAQTYKDCLCHDCLLHFKEHEHLLTMKETLQQKIDQKTKPLGALGLLESLALQIGLAQQTLTPQLNNPAILVFAGDHGIAAEGVSAYPPEVTGQMVLNFLRGGAAINVFCRQHGIQLQVVDAGVNIDFADTPGLVHAKIAKGTQSFLKGKAMTPIELLLCQEKAAALVEQLYAAGCNVVGFGEMGIGNTSAAAMLMHYLCQLPLEDCVGRGTGLDDAQLIQKLATLKQAAAFHGVLNQPQDILQTFGGFEMAQICYGMLAAAERNMLVLVDGFIASACFLVAYHMNHTIREKAVFCHVSGEQGHRRMLGHLGVQALLQLGMRLGEGTGCAMAYPIIESAVRFLNEMASFESAGVSGQV
jgi:nicotinate-nucleotide--dimethylbenzimidazole phosphoribosyltransferase